ncbi:glycoside hydrolase family 16 protein [Sanguibacter sp. 25GB23B1]|uniref:glycoside hydrolase family 16 protein n=1 Tax=Sanguibacter sp. 25GB23B1 TaxID=3156067 RepID=UPI0032AE8A97
MISSSTTRHAAHPRSTTALSLVLTSALTSTLALAAIGSPAAASAQARLAPATSGSTSCGELFDDFAYSSSSDPALRANGWTVRTGGGGPGIDGNTWSAANVDFPGTGSAQTARLRARTDGTPAGTVNAQMEHQRKFFEGTYATRIRFTDAPTTGADGDHVVQTFYTITPLDFPNDPAYGEADFEYLPNGGWGQTSAAMFYTTYETYQPDPWVADNISETDVGSLDGWHDLTLQVDSGVVRYYLDGTLVAEHGGHVYPETEMLLNMNIWFIDLEGHTGGTSTYEQEVDYVYYSDEEVVAPAEVTRRVAAYRASSTTHTDSVVAGACTAPSEPVPPVVPAEPAPAPTAPVAAVDCTGLRPWKAVRSYRAGATVTARDHAWRAERFTWRASPGRSARWIDLGACGTTS